MMQADHYTKYSIAEYMWTRKRQIEEQRIGLLTKQEGISLSIYTNITVDFSIGKYHIFIFARD